MQKLHLIVKSLVIFIGGSAFLAVVLAIQWIFEGENPSAANIEGKKFYNFRPSSSSVFHLCDSLEGVDEFFSVMANGNYWIAAMSYDEYKENCPSYNLTSPEISAELISETQPPLPGYKSLVIAKIVFTDIGERYIAIMQKETTGLSEGAQHALLEYRTVNGINETLNEALKGN